MFSSNLCYVFHVKNKQKKPDENKQEKSDENTCKCQSCIDKERTPVEKYLKPEMVSAFCLLWVTINHSLATNNYVQGEYVVWFALLDLLIWDSNVKDFTQDSIQTYRTTLLTTLNTYYQFFSPESLSRFEITYKIPDAAVHVCNIMSHINPTLFYMWIQKNPTILIFNMFCFAKHIQDLDRNCNDGGQLSIMLSRGINPDLLFTTNPYGQLILPDTGFIKPLNGHSGVTITSVSSYSPEYIYEIIINLLSAGKKVRIVKTIADNSFFRKYKSTIHINTRFLFYTHMLQLVKKN